jgi:hypothetical protein
MSLTVKTSNAGSTPATRATTLDAGVVQWPRTLVLYRYRQLQFAPGNRGGPHGSYARRPSFQSLSRAT